MCARIWPYNVCLMTLTKSNEAIVLLSSASLADSKRKNSISQQKVFHPAEVAATKAELMYFIIQWNLNQKPLKAFMHVRRKQSIWRAALQFKAEI